MYQEFCLLLNPSLPVHQLVQLAHYLGIHVLYLYMFTFHVWSLNIQISKLAKLFYITFCTLPGVTATGLFSQSLITTRLKPPHAIRRTKTSPDLSSSICDSIRSSSPLMNAADCTGTNNECQDKKGCIKDSDKQSITYSEDKSYSQSQVMIVTDKGTLHAFTVALALSVHSIFEGLAFGLQNSTSQVCEYVQCKYVPHMCICSFFVYYVSMQNSIYTYNIYIYIYIYICVCVCLCACVRACVCVYFNIANVQT